MLAIVEDDPSARAALSSLLGAMDFVAVGFPDAASFLEFGDLDQVGCLIADVRLPGMSGLQLHLCLRAAGRNLPTILITAYPDPTSSRSALDAGVRAYLAKPVQPEELHACLEAILGL
ncbi:Response regulator receiver domain-containing protein [Roseomonas rosea]|uniref:Response regulator receiver domain-containing protein n=2 Tax=Muricoccus roseus TaxID=198092 RepID=A0A1M6N1Y4_9PROT|nr:Response regulator receiver domain-containing protein [Roseomonas rosea]